MNAGKLYVDILKPKYFLPFAGQYTLTGKNHELNLSRGEPELDDAFEFYSKIFSNTEHNCIILNQNQTYLFISFFNKLELKY